MSAICGLLPRAGETVLIGPSAGPHFSSNWWFRVNTVRPSHELGWVYLDGVDLSPTGTPAPTPERTLFVRITGLVIRR